MPSAAWGRGSHLHPVRRQQQAPIAKPSREGEVRLSSDLLGRAVLLRFKQLRRLQSLLHNLRADGTGPTHLAYRVETWAAIKAARGFHPSFADWWPTRLHKLQGAPDTLPAAVPPLSAVELLFLDFQANFRSFESWNIRNRAKCARAKVQQHIHLAFQQVRDAPKAQIDWLTSDGSATIVYVAEDGVRILVDRNVTVGSLVTWRVNGTFADVKQLSSDTFEVDTDLLLYPGQTLHFSQHLTQEAQIHAELADYWKPRWNTLSQLPDEAWSRVVGFTRAFLPKLQVQMPPLQISNWMAALKDFKPTAARGPDGIGPADLRMMPQSFCVGLMDIFTRVENGAAWPQQLLTGISSGLPKHAEATQAGDYRPITVLGLPLRAWSSLRARQALHGLASHLTFPTFGFLPRRETKLLWVPLQGLIELCSQNQQPLLGFVSDICKAFNFLPRRHVKLIAKHVGLPGHIVNAWHRYLEGGLQFVPTMVIRRDVLSPVWL